MKTPLPFLASILALTVNFAIPLRAADQPIDMQRARQLYERSQAGEKLTDEEQKYLDEAKRQREAQQGGAPAPDREKMRALKEKIDRGEPLTSDEQKFADEIRRRMAAGGPPGEPDPATRERMRAIKEKMDRGEKLTDDEQRSLDEMRRRMSGGRPPGSEPDPAMREKLRGIREKMDRGEPLTDDEKRVAEEMRRRMAPPGDARPGEFNWERAKAAHEKEQRGEALTDDEKKLLAEARKRFEEGRGPDQPPGAPRPQNPPGDKPQAKDDFDWQKAQAAHQKEQRGETLNDEEKKLLGEAKKRMHEGRGPNRPGGDGARNEQRPPLAPPPKDLVPLNELKGKYKEQDGGLYGGGKNEPPAEHASLARKAIADIKPLDLDGKPATDGKVVLMSIGMSNTTQEFSNFVRIANEDSRKAAHVVIVDAAQGGRDAPAWAKADAQTWQEAGRRLERAGVSPAQVQALWIKQAIAGPHAGFPSETERLRDLEREIVTLAKQKYPNLRVAYLSSRIYAGYATGALNPEPYAYESGFAVRWLIKDQMKGAPALNAVASKGEVKAPVLLWGPYLWTNGEEGRKSDGLIFKREDLGPDGTHPSNSGREKVAKLLLDFFTTNELAKGWFTK